MEEQRASGTDRRLLLMELYGPANVINTKEMPASAAVRAASPIPPAVISSTVWSSVLPLAW